MSHINLNYIFTSPKIPQKLLMIGNNNYNKIEILSADANTIQTVQKKGLG